MHYQSRRMNGRVVKYRKPFHAATLGDNASITGFLVWIRSGKKTKQLRAVKEQRTATA